MVSHETTATATQRLDNDQVTVTQWDFAPGQSTGWHRHSMDYVVVPLTEGTLTLVTKAADGSVQSTDFQLSPGVAYTRKFGTEHEVKRPADDKSDGKVSFVEIEMKAYRG